MAKVSFTKLGLSKDKLNEITMIEFNGQSIEVKQYLPINEKMEMIQTVSGKAIDDAYFANPSKIQVFISLEIVYHYTNINFTEKQKEDEAKLYDLIYANNLLHKIIEAIPQDEYDFVIKNAYACVEAISTFHNSALGIVNSITSDYSNTEFDINSLVEQIKDPEVMATLKDIAPLLINTELETEIENN